MIIPLTENISSQYAPITKKTFSAQWSVGTALAAVLNVYFIIINEYDSVDMIRHNNKFFEFHIKHFLNNSDFIECNFS